jgi:SAM-dependent methyltransferase
MKLMMRNLLRAIYQFVTALGFDPRKTIQFARGVPAYIRDYIVFCWQRRSSNQEFKMGAPFPCLSDRFAQSGNIRGHYFYQDLLVANRVFQNKSTRHVDVGSRIDGFVAHVAAFRPIEVIDIRPLESKFHNIRFIQADLMEVSDGSLVDYCDSLSCLHALEHFGLGRYGDTVDYGGYLAGLRSLTRMLRSGGKFYLSVPIGPQRIQFNAHRIFSVEYILRLMVETFKFDSFSFIDDEGTLHQDVIVGAEDAKASFGCSYGCGIFEWTKL